MGFSHKATNVCAYHGSRAEAIITYTSTHSVTDKAVFLKHSPRDVSKAIYLHNENLQGTPVVTYPTTYMFLCLG